jgi:hypothetical protein
VSVRSRLLAAICAAACLALAASAAPAAASLLVPGSWDGAALNKPSGYEGPFLYAGPASVSPSGEVSTQAGSHPDVAATTFSLSTTVTHPAEQELPIEFLKDAVVEVPPGLVGNPQAAGPAGRCPVADLRKGEGGLSLCPAASQIGVARLGEASDDVSAPPPAEKYYGEFLPLYDLEPPPGVPALLGFQTFGVQVFVAAKVRTGGDYGLTLSSLDANQTEPFKDFTFEVWGTPADHSHDLFRDACLSIGPGFHGLGNVTGKKCESPEVADPPAFLTQPTACLGPLRTDLTARGWEGGEDHASFLSHDLSEPPLPIGIEGCDKVPFDPTMEARPTTNVADSPSGLDVDIHIPQDGIADPKVPIVQSDLKDATVTLPEGLVVNPAGANGLGACTSAQIDLHGEGPPQCPDSAKIGTVEASTPLLDHPLPGALYIAAPHDNPFGSLLALYLVVDDPQSGVIVKLAGRVEADPRTGQLSSTFEDNPQVPVEDVRLQVKEGPHAPLRTPATCSAYATTAELTPWSAAEGGGGKIASLADHYEISQGPGGSCAHSPAGLPNSPALDAGTVSPIAGHYSPAVVSLRREDGTQQFKTVTLSPPPGLVAKLAGTETCSDAALAAAAARSGSAEQASPSCPLGSRVGSVYAAAGAGPSPYWAPGTAYLAGPYKGAPLSFAIVTPAVAGPFDLGTVVIRVALHVDPETAQITAVSDPLPEILQGIPLDIRAAKLLLDRPDFTRNGTSCDPLAFSGQLLSTLGQAAPLSERFQLGECGHLAFKPKLSLRLQGGTKRAENPKLTSTLTAKEGEAAISFASVRLPRSAFLDQSHIRTICTRVQWAAEACPKGSIYGRAWAQTPLLDYRLAGNVYLRSSSHKLPDLIVDLRGPANQPIRIDLVGRTDSLKGALRTRFEAAPDAPVSKFHFELFGGDRGLVVNSRDVCANPLHASVSLRAHNGATLESHPLLPNGRCKGGSGHRRGRAAR